MKAYSDRSKRASLLAIALTLAAGGTAAGCASAGTGETTSHYITDSVLTTKVECALRDDTAVKACAVTVATLDRVVHLSGFVDTSAQHYAAGRDVWTVSGVRDLQNDLLVRPTAK